MQDAMANEEEQTNGPTDDTDATEPQPSDEQLSLAEVIARQREELAGTLGEEASLPDVSEPTAAGEQPRPESVEPSVPREPTGQAPSAEQPDGDQPHNDPSSEGEVAESASLDVPEDSPVETGMPEPAASADDGEPQEETAQTHPDVRAPDEQKSDNEPVVSVAEPDAASGAETPDQTDKTGSPATSESSDGDREDSDEASEPEVSEAQLTLAEIIAQQRAKLNGAAPEGAPSDTGRGDAPPPPEPPAAPEPPAERPPEAAAAKPTRTSQPRARVAKPAGRKPPARSAGRVRRGLKRAPAADAPPAGPRRTILVALFLGANTLLLGAVAVAVWQLLPSAARTGAATRTDRPAEASPAAPAAAMAPLEADMGGQQRIDAQTAFAFGKYGTAAGRYEQLMRRASVRPADAVARDLFAVRYARSMIELGRGSQARQALVSAMRSQSPILRAYACHMLAFLDLKDGTYLSARRRGYAAIGVLGAMRTRHALVDDCEYLIARAMSAKVVSLAGEKMDLETRDMLCADPMLGLSDVALFRLLGDGVDSLVQAGLNPSFSPAGPSRARQGWSARWSGPSVEQFLHQLTNTGGMDVRWGTADPAMRRRGVTVVLGADANEQRLAEVACGAAGLMARFTGREIVVMNPRSTESTKMEKELLGREAISMWRRFLLQHAAGERDDKRIAVGQYALARVYEGMGDLADALREYGLITRQHDTSRIAPRALLRAAVLRQELLDYDGARRDLLAMLDRYPDSGLFGPAYLNLGIVIRKKAAIDKTRRFGLLAEAAKVFARLYHLNISRDSRKNACIELARCLDDQGDHAKAAQWATTYLEHIDRSDSAGMCRGYFMLARTSAAAGKLDAAAKAFHQVLGSNPSAEMRIETLMRLVAVQLARGGYVQTIGALNALGREKLSAQQRLRYLVSLSESYRAMGLAVKAFSIIQAQIGEIRDLEMKDVLTVELARCQIDMGRHNADPERKHERYASARKLLVEVLAAMRRRGGHDKEGIQNVQVELADVLLDLGQTDAAIATAKAIVDMDRQTCPPRLRRRAVRALGQAYLRQGHYDLAAGVLMDAAAGAEGGASDG